MEQIYLFLIGVGAIGGAILAYYFYFYYSKLQKIQNEKKVVKNKVQQNIIKAQIQSKEEKQERYIRMIPQVIAAGVAIAISWQVLSTITTTFNEKIINTTATQTVPSTTNAVINNNFTIVLVIIGSILAAVIIGFEIWKYGNIKVEEK